MNSTGKYALYEWNDGREFLKENFPTFNPTQIICTQSFLWNPICHYHGCDLRPDRNFYSMPKGEIMKYIDPKEYRELQGKDPRTNPYNPQCFRCGKVWGACMDGL